VPTTTADSHASTSTPGPRRSGSARLDRFVTDYDGPTPVVVVDLDVVVERLHALRTALPMAEVFYAVKANPAPEILEVLLDEAVSFDVASPGEIDRCLTMGAAAERISFGNTVKKARDIAAAYGQGVRLFTFDCAAELDKLIEHAPGSTVMCRIAVDGVGADWPLSRKFGTSRDEAVELLGRAASHGLGLGVSFHVGSQQRNLDAWDAALCEVAKLASELAGAGHTLEVLNLGGGFPAVYDDGVPTMAEYGSAIRSALDAWFPQRLPRVIVEPGRYLVGDAGLLVSEVVLVSDRSDHGRWVYLDVGLFGGLAETLGEAIRYRITTERDAGDRRSACLAGPTCDSADVLYEKTPYDLPTDLAAGDRVTFHAAGAYTTSYSSVGFNGFAPLASTYLRRR
jgi:ornithine decarboxylase